MMNARSNSRNFRDVLRIDAEHFIGGTKLFLEVCQEGEGH